MVNYIINKKFPFTGLVKYKKLDLSFVYLNEPEDLVSLLVLLSGSILAANDADKNEFT